MKSALVRSSHNAKSAKPFARVIIRIDIPIDFLPFLRYFVITITCQKALSLLIALAIRGLIRHWRALGPA